jgi:hypothetical protein
MYASVGLKNDSTTKSTFSVKKNVQECIVENPKKQKSLPRRIGSCCDMSHMCSDDVLTDEVMSPKFPIAADLME